MVDVTDATFESAVLARSDQVPVIVDLWAPWCGPCKTLTPILERVVASANGSVELVKVNIDENQQLAVRYGVQSIPNMILFENGEPKASAIGAQPKTALERSLGLDQ